MKIVIAYFLFFVPSIMNGQSFKLLSIQEQVEDIEFVKSELTKLHPGICSYQLLEEFDDGFDSLIGSIKNDQTIFQFYKQLVPVINRIGCGHTTVKIPKKDLNKLYKSSYFQPIMVTIIDDRIFIVSSTDQGSYVQTATEVLSIDGVPADDYIRENLQLYPSDGRIMSRKYQSLERSFSIDYSKYNSPREQFLFVVSNKQKVDSITIQGITYEQWIKTFRPPERRNLDLYFIDSLSAAVMTIRNSESEKAYSIFLNESFQEIRKRKITNIIIDLRYDSFNRDSDGAELYSYLSNKPFRYYSKLEVTENYNVPKFLNWIAHYPIEKGINDKYYWTVHPQLEIQNPKSDNYEGEVYVLTDGFTFSATSEFSSIVKSNQRGLIIGDETGGSYYGNNSGGMLKRKLPNSKLKVIIPPMKYYLAVEDVGNYSRGVIPDIQVKKNMDHIGSNDDITLKLALKTIRQFQNIE